MTKLTVAFRHFAVAPNIDRLVQLRCDGQRHIGTEEQAGTDRKVAGDRVQLQGEELIYIQIIFKFYRVSLKRYVLRKLSEFKTRKALVSTDSTVSLTDSVSVYWQYDISD